MNHIPAIGNTKSGIHAGGDVLWAAGSTDASGNLLESLSYDPWGRRRKATDWTDYNVTSTLFDRGFTGHEHLPHFGLINMNGRVYDPFLARFLSPDPFVQAPNYSQNYNRYSYAFNNPLKYIDPSGYNNIRLDENTTAIPYIAGSSGYLNNWNYITSGIGPGSGNHWSDQNRSEWGNFMLGNSRSFDGMYGQGAWNSFYTSMFTKQATNGRVNSTMINDRTSISIVVGWMNSGFNLTIVSAFGRNNLIGSMGTIGSMSYGTGGGLIFSNQTAGMVVGEGVVGVGGLLTAKFDEPQSQDFSGFWGAMNYFLTGGNIDGYHYNMNGIVTGFAPTMGAPPSFIGGQLRKGEQALKLGKYLFNPTALHGVKKGVLSFANPKNFSHIVGTNPDLMFKGGKIWLTGTKNSGHFGKSYETGMTITEFLKLF
ncbi:MAG: RHS repeat-associated core domain-containing protein [Bacteroidales bacterium]|nr:RHS repeat-associated core domain-containing protein [Bacteroidales bacterium]